MGALATDKGVNLLIEYLDVCNTALEAHRHSLPYKPIIAAYDRVFANRQVGVEIYSDDSGVIETTGTIRLVDGMFEPVAEPEAHPSFHLKFRRRYMEGVVGHRQEYVRHPEKLDWDWLKSRLGMELHYGSSPGADILAVERMRKLDMRCEDCNRLERLFLELMVYADKAETALRCYFITHQWSAGVSDMDEYNALRADQQRTADQRHRAYMDLVSHAMNHGASMGPRELNSPMRI